MISGIYALYWWEQDLVYIGQSQNIKARWLEHINLLKDNKHTNYKVQEAYSKYGLPDFIVLEEVALDKLNNSEVYWQKEFNSLNSLDIIKAGDVGRGVVSNNSKYSKYRILRVFSRLYSSTLTYKKIAEIEKVHISLPYDIARSRSHTWLKIEYPTQFQSMLEIPRKYINKKTVSYTDKVINIISPEGKTYLISNIDSFSRDMDTYIDSIGISRKNFSVGISKLIRGRLKTYHGWKIV